MIKHLLLRIGYWLLEESNRKNDELGEGVDELPNKSTYSNKRR